MEGQFKKGTTTVGLLSNDGVVLAAEKRAVMGNLIANKEVRKIIGITPHIALTVAGSVGDAQMLARILKVNIRLYEIARKKRIHVEGAATLLANILQSHKWFPYFVQVLVGGYDTKPRLYSLDLLGSLLPEKCVATGSGSPIAYGVIEENYREGQSTKENAIIAAKAIKAAMERDSASGNGIDVAVITKSGIRYLKAEELLKKK